MRVTLRELAKACDCSAPSASRALKDDPNISDDLKTRVREAARELGYVPNAIAGSMRTGQTKTIAIILQDLLNPFFSIIANKMERSASNRGWNSIIITTDYSSELELKAVNTALGKNADGVIFLPVQRDADALARMNAAGMPYVLVGRSFDGVSADCVKPDDRAGAYLVIKHMLEKGRNRILFINSFDYISSSRLREEGYRQALKEFGVSARKRDIFHISTEKGQCDAVLRELARDGKWDYSALFCYCDALAYEAYATLTALGMAIPGDVALAGVDDLDSYITFPVRLTSAGYDMQAMAEQAVDLLIRKIEHKRLNSGMEWQARERLLSEYLSPGATT